MLKVPKSIGFAKSAKNLLSKQTAPFSGSVGDRLFIFIWKWPALIYAFVPDVAPRKANLASGPQCHLGSWSEKGGASSGWSREASPEEACLSEHLSRPMTHPIPKLAAPTSQLDAVQ